MAPNSSLPLLGKVVAPSELSSGNRHCACQRIKVLAKAGRFRLAPDRISEINQGNQNSFRSVCNISQPATPLDPFGPRNRPRFPAYMCRSDTLGVSCRLRNTNLGVLAALPVVAGALEDINLVSRHPDSPGTARLQRLQTIQSPNLMQIRPAGAALHRVCKRI